MNKSLASNYNIRFAQSEDLPLLSDIERSASTLFQNTPYSFLANAAPLPLAVVKQWFQEGQIWVAVNQQDLPVGFAIATEVDGTLYIAEIDVDPVWGQRGIGGKLVETVCAWAKVQNYQIVSLSTFRDLKWNAPFYEKLGFRILDESELSNAFQKLRTKEAESGLPIGDRAIMYLELWKNV